LYIPFIQSKQFPVSWETARKTRLGPQQYLLTTTSQSQISLLIYLSQDGTTSYNDIDFPLIQDIIPNPNSPNNSVIYSSVLYTCPESTNLGLTPANVNLNMPTAYSQQQIWHRMNTSLIGDTVQVGFTMSDAQMRELDPIGIPFTITGATNATECVLTANNSVSVGQLVQIMGVIGMTQLNFNPSLNNNYIVLSSSPTEITIEVDSTGFGTYMSGGMGTVVASFNPTAEIEIHGFILDVQPSMVLA
jgi:hypothetical protein